MSFEETLKEYFETLIQSDNAIKAVYSEEKIANCASYIFKVEVMQSEQEEEPAEVKKPAKKAPKVKKIDETKGQLNLFDFGD